MIKIDFEEGQKKTFPLHNQERIVRGKVLDTVINSSYVELSEVITYPITATTADEDKELVQFLKEQDDNYRFNVIRIGCTFRSGKGEKFGKAWISEPMRIEGDSDSKPLVWSMTPENRTEDIEFTKTITIGSALKFITGEASHEKSTTKKDFFITSYREGKASPLWEFKKTENIDITGSYACYLIIRTKKTDHVQGKVQVKAVIQEKTYVIFNKEKDLADSPFLTFELKPSD